MFGPLESFCGKYFPLPECHTLVNHNQILAQYPIVKQMELCCASGMEADEKFIRRLKHGYRMDPPTYAPKVYKLR